MDSSASESPMTADMPDTAAHQRVGDRRALSDLESAIAEVWSEILRRPRIGAADNFFELGGDSLAATRMIIRLRTALDIQLPLHTLFDHPALEDFAAAVEVHARDSVRLPPRSRASAHRRFSRERAHGSAHTTHTRRIR